jgi:hypothetical protein
MHSADQRVNADQRRNLRLVVDQGAGIQLRRLADELLVQLLPLGRCLSNDVWRGPDAAE